MRERYVDWWIVERRKEIVSVDGIRLLEKLKSC